MMEREERIKQYYIKRGLWDKEFTTEADMLKYTLEFLNMMPNTVTIRKEASTVAGIADLLICYCGRFVAIELKDNTGTTSPQQDRFILNVRNAGGIASVARRLCDVYILLKEATVAT